MFQFFVTALLLTICSGQTRAIGSGEVKAFLDETGHLHWAGHTYLKKEGVVTKSVADKSTVQATSCDGGLLTSAFYGSAERNITLAQTLAAGEVLVFFCSEAFAREDFSGHFLVRCVAAGALEIEYHCGCAAGALPRPKLQAEEYQRRPLYPMCSALPKRSTADQADPDIVWSSGSLDDGASEDHLCSELMPGALGAWKIRCFEGRLCAEFGSCMSRREPTDPAQVLAPARLREQVDSAESTDVLDLAIAALEKQKDDLPNDEAAKEEELRWQDSVSRRIRNWNETAAPRRLVAVALCLNPPKDNWWPDICAKTADTPYSTVAGARGAGEQMDQLDSPYGIFVSPINEDLYIADWKNHRIQKWPQGEGIGLIQTVAGEAGQVGDANDLRLLFNPSDIVVSQTVGSGVCGEMFIADESNNRVLRWPPYSNNGFVVAGGPDGELDHPTGIYVTDDLDIYIADRLHHRVILYTKDFYRLEWKQNSTFFAGLKNKAPGSSLDALDRPTDVALNPQGDVFIADFGNARLVRWRSGDTVGTYIGRCYAIFSVFINEDGLIFAACQTTHCIKRWEPVGNGYVEGPVTGECAFFVQAPHIDSPDYLASLGRFFSPSGVFVDKYGNIYVSDTGNSRVVKLGRDPLTQWIVTNGVATGFKFEITRVEMYTDLACSQRLPIKTNISADGVVKEPWKPSCSQAGNNRCAKNDAWFGRQFMEAAAIRCVVFAVDYTNSGGALFDAAIRYWTGSYFRTVYNFGQIPANTPVKLRFPRFDADYLACVKGQRFCTLDFTGDWQADGDRVLLTAGSCDDGMRQGLLGFPSAGMSEPAVSDGTSYTIGDASVADYITNDASDSDRYKICWCDRRLKNCQLGTDFTLFVAYLTLEGPYDLQQQFGWRGSPLNLTELLGVGLKPGDKLTVISGKCGIAATDVVGIPRQPNLYIAASAPSITGLDYNWGTKIVNTDPSTYELCWCRPYSLTGCTDLLDFQARAGNLSINGPLKKQHVSCVKGDPCSFQVKGVNFQIGDSILILVRCGQGPLLNGFPDQGIIPRTVTRSTSSGSIGKYGWGPVGINPTAGMYYVCWCGVQFNPTVPEDFAVEVGFITIKGPEEKPLICALGADCTVTLTGVNMEISKRGMVVPLDTECGSDTGGPVADFPGDPAYGDGVSYLADDDGTQLKWGYVDQTKVIPDTYRACWCHEGSNCTTLTDFKVSLGQMTIIGPKEWEETKNCGVNKDCIVELLGLGLSRKDTMVLIDGPCGSDKLAQTDEYKTVINDLKSRTVTGGSHNWVSDQMNNYGEFSVCWCSEGCDAAVDYQMTVGKIQVSSPDPGQKRYCTSGAACYIRLDGFGLRTSDRIAIMTPECGSAGTVVPGIPNLGRSITTIAYPLYATFILGVDDNGTNVVNANGGVYAMCWCPSRCNSVRDYLFHAGDLTLWGPAGDHGYTCYNGKACVATGVRGIGLQDGDQVRASSTCRIMLLVGGLPQQGVSLGAVKSGREFTWGPNKLQAIVGKYRLCWCSISHDIKDPEDYVVDMGHLIIGGPVAGQSHICQAGYSCSLDGIEGFGLQQGDYIVILFTCGTGDPIDREYKEGDPWRAWPPFISAPIDILTCDGDGISGKCKGDYAADEGNFIFNADTGKYRMCWCDSKTGTCLTKDDFTVDIGLFTAVGPDADQEYFCVPGYTCVLNKLKGVSLFPADEYVLQKDSECRGGNVVEGVPNNGISEPAMDGGRQVTWSGPFAATTYPKQDYTLCWCPVQVLCTEPDEFVTRAAIISVLGPLPNQNYECLLGDPCIIADVNGVGLQNKDRIIAVSNACGPGAVVAPDFPSLGMSAEAEETGTKYTFNMLINAKTGRYRLCWCPFSRTIDPVWPVPFQCLNIDSTPILGDFTVDLGELLLPEVPQAGEERECISGNHCVIDGFVGSTGGGLPSNSQIEVKMNQSEVDEFICEQNSVNVPGFPNGGESNPATINGTTFAWGDGETNESIWAEGGTYIMCWKPAGVGYYAYMLGFLTILGPGDEEQEFRCTKSAQCLIQDIVGYGMGDGDYFRVMQPCAGNLDEDLARENNVMGVTVARMEEGVVEWHWWQFQAAPAYYSICWCHRGNECKKPFDFKTTVGTIIVNGPVAGQNRKCDRGQSCEVNGIDGINLMEGDQAQVLVECGVGPAVQNMFDSIVTASEDEEIPGKLNFFWYYTISSPGIYRTCWCQASECNGADAADLGAVETFDVEIGILTIQGPYNGEYQEVPEAPLWNQQWDITLKGVNLHVTKKDSRLRIMKECPDRQPPVYSGEEVDGNVRIGQPRAGDETGSKYFFEKQDLRSIIPATWKEVEWVNNDYVLCWCGYDCSEVGGFALKIGDIHVLCEKGSQPIANGCELCPVGRFKEIDYNQPCQACPNELWTTKSEGTRLESECYCKPGYYYERATLECTACPINYFCVGGNRTDNGQRQQCPSRSGAWPRSGDDSCPKCTGNFPAESVTDCSCIKGAEAGPTSCEDCPLDYFKLDRGNASECVLCSDEFSKSTTGDKTGQYSCTCNPGMYMIRDENMNPQYCADCPQGSWCANGDRNKCPPGRYTVGRKATKPADCLCGPGYFSKAEINPVTGVTENKCRQCPGGSLFFKSKIGDEKCKEPCPKFSTTVEGAAGPENCLCEENYIQRLNLTSYVYTCELDSEGLANQPQTRIQLTAVYTQALFLFHPNTPSGLTRFPAPAYFENDPLVAKTIGTELGFEDGARVKLKPMGYVVDPRPNVTTQQAHEIAQLNESLNYQTLRRRRLSSVSSGRKLSDSRFLSEWWRQIEQWQKPGSEKRRDRLDKWLRASHEVPTRRLRSVYERHGPGYCRGGFLRRSQGVADLQTCEDLCSAEDDCAYFSYNTNSNQRCRRYNGEDCSAGDLNLGEEGECGDSPCDYSTFRKAGPMYLYAEGSVIVPVEVVIWQGTVRETQDVEKEVQVFDPSNAQLIMESSDPEMFDGLESFTFRKDQIRLDFHWEYCDANSAVPPAATFVSVEESCKCAPGYQAYAGIDETDDDIKKCAAQQQAISGVASGKCVPCCLKGDPDKEGTTGTYKDNTGDAKCTSCKNNFQVSFPKTDPELGANSSEQCICAPGKYRHAVFEECIDCPLKFFCDGGYVTFPCPPNENTKATGQDNVSDCECDLGYFKPFPHEADKPCLGCDPGYYKSIVENGIGRCTERCSNFFGTRSTSKPAAISKDECVCSEFSYMRADPEAISGFNCEPCPPEGVTCMGWKKNVSSDEPPFWKKIHSPPEANLGFFMLDRRYAVVEACRIQTAAEGSVCRGKGECADGHEGLLCGNCQIGWTRPQFPAPCRTCSTMPPTGVLVLQILGDVSFQAFMSWFLAYSALIKTETQKNVMTVLLRLLMHWSTQVGVLSSFNLTKLHPLATADEEVEEEEEEEEVVEEVAIELPPNETDVPLQEGFAFPGFFSEVAGQMTKVGAIINGLGSTQEVIECMIDRRFQGDGTVALTEVEEKQLKKWKLVGPAIWWLLYPVLNVIWVMFLAANICFAVVPIANYFSKKPNNPKKKRKKLRKMRLAKARERMKAKQKEKEKAEEDQKAKTPKLSQLIDGMDAEVEVGIKVTKDDIENFSDDSSSASSSDSDETDKADDIEKYLLYTPEFLALCDEMVASVANPSRFSYEYVSKDTSEKEAEDAASQKVVEYYFQLFRKKPIYSREFIVDIAPWIIILLNNVWNVITGRMLQLLYCEKFHWSGTSEPDPSFVAVEKSFLMMSPDVECYTTESLHGILVIIAVSGLSTWSFGILLGYYVYINKRDKQSRLVTRNFGYMLEGYEPQFWYWELTIKKVDLLVTSIITYTNLAPEPRAKILLYSVQSAIAFAVQLSTGPYDNRQLRLLDNMENLGLLVRQLIFTGISFSLLFGGGKGPIMILAVVLVVFVLYFFLHLVVHAADDWLSTQVAITKEVFVHDHIDAQRKALKKMKKAGIPIDPDHLPEVNSYNVAHQTKFKLLTMVQNFFPFRGGSSENGYRHAQLLRCMWNGPGTDAVLYVPEVFEGWPYGQGFWRKAELWGIKWFNGLTASHQQDAFAEHMGCFVALLLSLANFNQFPARFTDMVFFLARAVKRLKNDMERHPNTVRPAKPRHDDDEEPGKPLQFKDREWLKVGMLEELYSSMIEEGSDKRNLLERVRKGVRDVLKREHIPLEAAWDVLDRLTNDQLRRAVLSPVALFARVGFFLILSASTERCTETVAHYTMMHHEEKKARKKMYRYVQFALREQIEENAELDMDWTYIHQVLEALPVVELKRLLKDPIEIIDVAKAHHYLLHDEQDEDFKSSSSVMTVEDINSMLMFLQKLPYDQLHHIIEYTQMLLDFLSLPAKASWRDKVVERGRRMGKAPDYYRRSRQQRIKMREAVAMEAANKADEEEEEDNVVLEEKGPTVSEVPQAPAMGSMKKKVVAPEEELAATFEAFTMPATTESKLKQFYNSQMVVDLDDVPAVAGGILCDMDDLPPDDNMSVSSLGSLDDAIQWDQEDEEQDMHKDALWKKIDGLRKKTGQTPFYNVTGSKGSGSHSPHSSARGSHASRQDKKSDGRYSSIPSTLSGDSRLSSISSANSERLMEDLMRRSVPRSPRKSSDGDPDETHV